MTATTAPGERTQQWGARRRTPRLLALLLAVVLGVLTLNGASDAEGTFSGTTATAGECVSSGQVWLHVQTDKGEVLRSECVGTPDTGSAALAAADVAMRESKGGYLCTLAGYPEKCPRKFTGAYWQYSHAPSLDAAWSFSTKGAGEYRPRPGSVEGWCYGLEERERCELPRLRADHETAERVDKEWPSEGLDPWVAGGVVLLVVAAAATALLIRRRGAT